VRFQIVVRLVPAVLLFLTALLGVLRAPTHLLWMLAIGVTEGGHFLALLCLGAAFPLWSNTWYGRAATGLCLVAAFLSITPVLRAAWLARDIPRRIHEAFPIASTDRPQPLAFANLFLGLSPPDVQPQKLVYRDIEGSPLALDFYPSQDSKPAPLIVVIHGGSWNSGDNTDFIPMDRYLAGRGLAVADVLYRLAPQSPFPAASEDVRAAIAYLRNRAADLRIDPDRIVLLGRSAGGQIALHVACSANDPGIRGVISFYGPTDLFWSWEHPENPLVIDTRAKLTDYLGGGPSTSPSRYEGASPVRQASSALPPVLLIHGGRDEVVSPYHSDTMARRLTELGVPNLYVSLPWATHGFDYFLQGPGSQISIYAIESFLGSVLDQHGGIRR
jgi:acetyl esterase/lipase